LTRKKETSEEEFYVQTSKIGKKEDGFFGHNIIDGLINRIMSALKASMISGMLCLQELFLLPISNSLFTIK
jgi:hypothetical protein